jgi:hypothetical protein
MVLTVYDGLPSLILQPFFAAATSAIVVAVAILPGIFLRVAIIFRWSTAKPLWETAVAGTHLVVLVFGYFLGLTDVGVNPNPG